MSTIFIETISKAISDYRQMLRRHLTQSERISKLAELQLKNPDYKNEASLYRLGHIIVHDIEENLNPGVKNYYSYSGVGNFCRYLKEFLSNYIVENDVVVHRAQKASSALLKAIQLLTLSSDKITSKIMEQISRCNNTIAIYGSEEQCAIYKESLERTYRERGAFYAPLLRQFNEQTSRSQVVSEAA